MKGGATTFAFEEAACPCGSHEAIRDVFRTETRRYVECRGCGLVFRSPRPIADLVTSFYRDEYDGAYGRAEGVSDRRAVFESVLGHIERYKRSPGRLLDVGCGDGDFLVLCRSRGWSCFGVELSTGAAARAAARGLAMLPPDWVQAAPPSEERAAPYDVITLINVLETVPDPLAVLRRVRAALAPNGLVAVRVSNGAFHLAMRRPARWVRAQYQQAFHLFVYSPRALSRLSEAAGFHPVSVRNSRPSRGQVRGAMSRLKRWIWRIGGPALWGLAQAAYGVSGGRLVWAPSFELIATSGSVAR
jgi:2-polyprenyl-3-methyl-5-hydroxy-6-metoxy-1,4-benzoquinol methylase